MGKDHGMYKRSRSYGPEILVALASVLASENRWGSPVHSLAVPSEKRANVKELHRERRFQSGALTSLRPNTGIWTTNGNSLRWGLPGDVPILADFDGDGAVDPAVLRRTESVVWIHFSGGRPDLTIPLSASANPSVTEDFDGDGKDDLAWVEVQDSQFLWTVQVSSGGPPSTFLFGAASDVAAAIDYDGDGHAEPAVLSIRGNKRWLTVKGKQAVAVGSLNAMFFAVPNPGQPDRIFVWEPKTGEWFRHAAGKTESLGVLGKQPDLPVPADYDRNGSIDRAVWSGRSHSITFDPGSGSPAKNISLRQPKSDGTGGSSFPLLATLIR
jgi:hypothetical protein